jgi:hypothetical protein
MFANPLTRRSAIGLALLAAVALAGCATAEKRVPMTLEQVIQHSKAGTPPADIINQLKESRTVFEVSGSQFAKLREEGVDDSVLDFIQRTYVASVEMDTRLRYQSMYWGYGWGYPYRPYYGGWPYWYAW